MMDRIPPDYSPRAVVSDEGPACGITPPAFFDDGYSGSWLDCLAHSPWLKVSEYRGCRLADRDDFAPPSNPFHDPSISREA